MQNPTDSSSNTGSVVSIRGSVVDVRFPNHLPGYLNRLDAGEDGSVIVEVIAHLNAEVVRGIALTPTSGLARGSPVTELSASDRQIVYRARRLERFLTQPFFSTEQFTNQPGRLVSLEAALEGCDRILNNEFADQPESALYMIGDIGEVRS